MKKVLVIAAHPDDEILGCGGTMAKHVQNNDLVKVVIAAEGITSRYINRDSANKDELAKLKVTATKANNCLGVQNIEFLNFPDNRMDQLNLIDVIKPIEAIVLQFQPNIIYTHHSSDLNIDHSILNQAVITACRPLPGSTVQEVYFFEVLSATHWGQDTAGFACNFFNEISAEHLNKKNIALEIYFEEMREFPHARSIKAVNALATLRGAIAGKMHCEAFQLYRMLR